MGPSGGGSGGSSGAAANTSDVPEWVYEPGPGMQVELAGVNLSCAEFGESIPGTYGADYTYPTPAEVDHFVGKGMNVFRIPFRWERLQPTLNDPFESAELESANAATAAIRDVGADNLVFVPGNHWSGAHSWNASYYGTSNADVMTGVVDPADNFVFEVHQYLDADSSGAGTECVSETIGVERLEEFTAWLRENGFLGFLGEFGGHATPTCFRALDDMLAHIGDNTDAWFGWGWWAAGPWWGNYPLSIEPTGDGEDRPQMILLERHLTVP